MNQKLMNTNNFSRENNWLGLGDGLSDLSRNAKYQPHYSSRACSCEACCSFYFTG
jgi:hypothetical protein